MESRRLQGGIRARTRAALADTGSREALASTAGRFRNARAQAVAEYGAFDALRDHGRAIRAHTIENLPEYLELLQRRVEALGGYVHRVTTARQAVEAVMQVVRRRRARLVTKSKSMVSEEIGLNKALESEGIRVVETDLGEYILQLAHEPPFHIIAPALHKTRAQVARLFRDQAGASLPLDPTIPELTAFARQQLREEFLSADIGITGCNFAVAESGSVILVTNEGNGRMQSTLPPVMITIMGMERVVPTWEDAGVLLELLARSATGQKLTSYTTVVTGPRRAGEADGPEEFHLIIVDNGRSRLLGTEFQEVLHCIRCGACLNACPVYQQIGGHAYGWVYSGPIGSVVTPLLRGIGEWGELAQASSLCGACWEACPVRIPLHDYLVRIRQQEAMGAGRPRHPREADLIGAWTWIMSGPDRYEKALRAAGRLAGPFSKDGYLKRLPGWIPVLGEWISSRDFPAPARRPFRDRWTQLERELYGSPPAPLTRKQPPVDHPGWDTRRSSSRMAGRPGARPPSPPVDEPLFQRFASELEAVGGVARSVAGSARLAEYLTELVQALAAEAPGGEVAVLRWQTPELEALELDGLLARAGARVLPWPVAREEAARARLGITWAHAAIASTGTLALEHGEGRGRQVSLLPPVHVALFRADALVPHLADYLARFAGRPERLPSNVTLVTGPSRTADIEQTLTVGVHGPGQVHALLLE